ncbi:MAG: PASTA domain-containing protein [Vicinamibacterales bacterium]
MRFDTMNVVFSLVLLHQRRVAKEKALAAAMGAGIVGGPTGLLLPIIVAGRTRPNDFPRRPPVSGPVMVAVPGVVGTPVDEATKTVADAGLRPVASIHYTSESDPDLVLQQEPDAGKLVRQQSDVDLVVAQTPPPEAEPSESQKEDEILVVTKRTLAKVEELASSRPKPQKS